MVNLTRMNPNGINPATASTTLATPEEIPNASGQMFFLVINPSGAAGSAQVRPQGMGEADGNKVANGSGSIGVGSEKFFGPFTPALWNDENGNIDLVNTVQAGATILPLILDRRYI